MSEFKPLAFGLLSGDKPEEALQNAIGNTSIAGKLYMDDKKKREEEAARATEAGTQPVAGEGMKKGGKVSSASRRADGAAQRGKTRGRMV